MVTKTNQTVDHCDMFGSAIVYHPCAPLFKQTSGETAALQGVAAEVHMSVSLCPLGMLRGVASCLSAILKACQAWSSSSGHER